MAGGGMRMSGGDRGEQLSVHIPVIRYRLKTGLVRSTL